MHSQSGACPASVSSTVGLATTASDPDGDTLLYSYTVTGGRVTGAGANVSWDLSGVGPGTYTASVDVDDGRGCVTSATTTVTIATCTDCVPEVACPQISMGYPEQVYEDQPVTFSAGISGTPAPTAYNWTISAGTITSGQGTPSITVSTDKLGGENITATLELGGVGDCPRTASGTTHVRPGRGNAHRGIYVSIVDPVTKKPVRGVTLTVIGPSGQALQATLVGESTFQIPFDGFGNYQVRVTSGSVTIPKVLRLDPPPGPGPPEFNFTISFSATESASPTPASSVEPSPSPSGSATATPELPDKVKKRDQVKATYPSYFEKAPPSTVTFELDRVSGEVVAHQTNINGGIELVDTPPFDPHAIINTPIVDSRGDQYVAHATVSLITTGVTIVEGQTIQQSLEPEHVTWNWKVIPDGLAKEASLKFQVDIVWKAKEPGRPDHPDKFSFDWPTRISEIRVPIGPPKYVQGMKYGAFPLCAAGVVALGLGRRRRSMLAAADEEDDEDEVTASVFAPGQATPGSSFLVQVFAHLEDQASLLEAMAKAADEDSRMRVADQLTKTIKRGATLTFQLLMPGLEIDEEVQHRVWKGKALPVQFGVTVPKGFDPKDVVAQVIICEESVPIGHLRFKIKIVAGVGAPIPPDAGVNAGSLTRYHHAFISYASEDRSEVAKRVQAFNLLGLGLFFDFLSLEPGDLWEKKIYQHIDQCDVFFLFWSRAASNSEWVHKEVAYALKRKTNREEIPPEILPVIIERPPAPPPKELSFLHFNDKFMWFIDPTKPGADDIAG